MSKMKEFSMAMDEITSASEVLIQCCKDCTASLDTIMTAVRELKSMFESSGYTSEAVLDETTAKVEEDKPQPVKEYSFTDIRGIMAGLSGMGKKAEAKALLQKYGASRLSDVKQEDYAALAADAEAIANG